MCCLKFDTIDASWCSHIDEMGAPSLLVIQEYFASLLRSIGRAQKLASKYRIELALEVGCSLVAV